MKVTLKVMLKVTLNSEVTPKLVNFDNIIYYSLFIFSETMERMKIVMTKRMHVHILSGQNLK